MEAYKLEKDKNDNTDNSEKIENKNKKQKNKKKSKRSDWPHSRIRRNAICEKSSISYGNKIHFGNRWKNW